MNNIDLVTQIAALRWLIDESAENTALLKLIASGRLAVDVYDRLSHSSQIDALKTQVISNIAAYIAQHPRATEDELVSIVRDEIVTFRIAISRL